MNRTAYEMEFNEDSDETQVHKDTEDLRAMIQMFISLLGLLMMQLKRWIRF